MAAFSVCSPSGHPSPSSLSTTSSMKTTCGSSSCSAVNSSLPRCGEAGQDGYQNLCPCIESGRKCLCKPRPQIMLQSSSWKCLPVPDPRNLSSWPLIRKITLVTAGVIPVVWLVVYVILKWHYNME
eukprot:TRINITY_DN8102_c0_g1_i1.p1 TRINITY_DN8102_c0_g1~~TRINITY_DN8102_c0_g1_i1.p1  ORF type:complete len:126 (+),score=27.11 TRINITY_DN8102_c0_g1_i1:42-419(+)